MSAPAKDDDVYQQFLATPEYKAAEIIQGRLITNSRPASPHARAASLLGVSSTRSAAAARRRIVR
jgi:hypothetical protein